MRAHKAYLRLLWRMSRRWLLAIAGVTAAAEGVFFWLAARRAADVAEVLDSLPIQIVMMAALIGLFIPLGLAGSEALQYRQYNTQSYTLRRLSLSHRERFLLQSLYKTGAALLLWAVQIGLLLGLSALLLAQSGDTAALPSLLSAFVGSELGHTLLPLGDPLLWVRNLLLVLMVGTGLASFALDGNTLIYAGFFTQLNSSLPGLSIVISVAWILISLFMGLRKEVFDDAPSL